MSDAVVDSIVSWLNEHCPPKESSVQYNGATALLADNILDSVQLLQLVTHLEDSYHISMGVDALVPENFQSPNDLARLVGERLAASSK